METGADYIIKRLEKDELHAVTKLDEKCFPSSPWGEDAFKSMLNEGFDSCFVCKDRENSILGYFILRRLDVAELLQIAVAEESRRRGIGEALIKKIYELCKDSGISEVFLEVREGNTAAIRLYEKLGFSEISRRRGYYSNPREDAVIMTAKTDIDKVSKKEAKLL